MLGYICFLLTDICGHVYAFLNIPIPRYLNLVLFVSVIFMIFSTIYWIIKAVIDKERELETKEQKWELNPEWQQSEEWQRNRKK